MMAAWCLLLLLIYVGVIPLYWFFMLKCFVWITYLVSLCRICLKLVSKFKCLDTWITLGRRCIIDIKNTILQTNIAFIKWRTCYAINPRTCVSVVKLPEGDDTTDSHLPVKRAALILSVYCKALGWRCYHRFTLTSQVCRTKLQLSFQGHFCASPMP